MSSPSEYDETLSQKDLESGYVSGESSDASLPDIVFTKTHLQFINQHLQNLETEGMCLTPH